MTGEHVRAKIRERGHTFRQIAHAIGETDQNFRMLLSGKNVSTETLERIAAAMNVSVAYFYNEQPIFSLVDYAEYESRKKEVELLRQIIRDKEALIEELKKNR